jgi:hypothetical protein
MDLVNCARPDALAMLPSDRNRNVTHLSIVCKSLKSFLRQGKVLRRGVNGKSMHRFEWVCRILRGLAPEFAHKRGKHILTNSEIKRAGGGRMESLDRAQFFLL